MKHTGRAFRAGIKIIAWTLILTAAIIAAACVAEALGGLVLAYWKVLVSAWFLFALFTFYFFRDPQPMPSAVAGAIVAPAHGKVDLIDEVNEPEFMGGPCQRLSIFLSVFDVHIQNSPVNGKVTFLKYVPGRFLSATRSDCGRYNENSLIGMEAVDFPGQKVAVRQIAGLIARRIMTWVEQGEKIPRGQRIGLIQFGSRVELYLPKSVKIQAKLGEKVKGGETIVATFQDSEPIQK